MEVQLQVLRMLQKSWKACHLTKRWILKTQVRKLFDQTTDIAGHLKLPPVKLHCSMLAEDAIKAAVKDYKKKVNTEVAGVAK